MQTIRKATIIILFTLTVACSSVQVVDEDINYLQLKGQIENILSDTRFSDSFWGILIKSLKTGETWYEQNSDKMFMPASNEKIPTTASALINLGPDFKFETIVSYIGTIEDSILYGDLIITGDGDPTLYEKFYPDTRTVFYEWAERLKAAGIREIRGDIIGNDDLFDDNTLGSGWPLDGLQYWYSAEIGPLQLNENYIDLEIKAPDSLNGEILINPNLPSNYYSIINNLLVTDSGKTEINIERSFGTNQIRLDGKLVSDGRTLEISPSITNSTLFYVTVLMEVLKEKGIAVTGIPVDCDDVINLDIPTGLNTVLIRHFSPTLSEIIKGLLKRSQNLYAETMVRILGLKDSGRGTFKAGRKVVYQTLQEMGIDSLDLQYRDGSGLSRYNYISPAQLVKILEFMNAHTYRENWKDALPVAGIDGTLRNRMKSPPVLGNVRAKTGTISNVRGLSGYVTTADGEELVFSFLVNAHLRSTRETEEITDGILELLASFKR